jgi:excisionase family DNA binding protein
MRMVSGLIEVKYEVVVEERIPPGVYMTVQEYAEMRQINESTLRTKLSRGEIPSYLFYGKRLIPRDFEADS